jgi:LysM repeat protein
MERMLLDQDRDRVRHAFWERQSRILAIAVILAVAALLIAQPAAVTSAPPASGPVVHVVRWGENLTMIAARYGVSVADIVQANRISNPNRIYVGQQLIIPGQTTYTPSQGSGVQHVVQSGDTLSAIAARYGSTTSAIVQANQLVNPSYIFVGQVLWIPTGGTPLPSAGGTYVVRAGDTLAGIAYRFGVNYWAIVQANNLYNPSLIYVGQVLLIPGAMPLPQPPPAPSGKAAVEGWVGVIVSNPPGAQYDDYFENRNGERFGIASSDPAVAQKLIDLRDTGKTVFLWGTLQRNVPDVNGVQIAVTRAETSDIETVDGWVGKIIKLPTGAQYDDYFERDNRALYGINGTTDTISEQIKDFRWSGALVKIWGKRLTNAPDYNSTQILVERIEPIWEPGQPTPTPGPTSSVGPTPTPTATPIPRGPVAMPSPAPPKPLRTASPEYGMNVYLWGKYDSIIDRDLQLVKDAGFTWVKQLFRWRDIEVQKGKFDWTEADHIVAMVNKYNLDLAIAVAYQPEWAGGGYPLNGPPRDMADFAEFMAALAERYKGLVRAYEIWPGPNVSQNWGGQSPDYKRYAEMLIDAYWFVKEKDPFVMVISGGLVQTAKHDGNSVPPITFFRSLIDDTKVRGAWDAIGVEALGFLAAPENTPDEAANAELNNHYPATRELNRTWCFRSIEVLYEASKPPAPYPAPDTQWVITNMGWTTDTRERSFTKWAAVSEEVKADYLRRAYRWAEEKWAGWVGVVFVPLTDANATAQDDIYWWGIVNPDGSTRPAYTALKNIVK